MFLAFHTIQLWSHMKNCCESVGNCHTTPAYVEPDTEPDTEPDHQMDSGTDQSNNKRFKHEHTVYNKPLTLKCQSLPTFARLPTRRQLFASRLTAL